MFAKTSVSLFAILFYVSVCSVLSGQVNDNPAQAETFELDGCADLEPWMSDGDRKQDWTINDENQLVCGKPSYLYRRLEELPKVCKIDIVISWEERPNFQFGFGAPIEAEQLDKNFLVRLENWEEAVVLSARDNFEVVFEAVPDDAQEIHLRIVYNNEDGTIVVEDKDGKRLSTARFGVDREHTVPGITLINRKGGGDLVIEKLKITSIDQEEKDK